MYIGDLWKNNTIPGIIDTQIRIRDTFAAAKILQENGPKKYSMLLIAKSCFSILVDEMSSLKKLAADSVWNECR